MSVRLRPLEESDVDDILTWVNDPEIVGNLAAFSGDPFTRDQELEWIRRVRSSRSEVVFTITAADDGRYLGQCGIHQIHERSKVGRLACIIAQKQDMGRGHGSAAIRAVLDHAFDVMQLHKIWLMVFAHNSRSRGINGRIGFREEGTLREEYFHEGAWHDMVRMSMLAREWQAIREGRGSLPQQ